MATRISPRTLTFLLPPTFHLFPFTPPQLHLLVALGYHTTWSADRIALYLFDQTGIEGGVTSSEIWAFYWTRPLNYVLQTKLLMQHNIVFENEYAVHWGSIEDSSVANLAAPKPIPQDRVWIRSPGYGLKVLLAFMMADRLLAFQAYQLRFREQNQFQLLQPAQIWELNWDLVEKGQQELACGICKEGLGIDNVDGEVERGVRLLSCCGQIIGETCLKEWARWGERTCPGCRFGLGERFWVGLFGGEGVPAENKAPGERDGDEEHEGWGEDEDMDDDMDEDEDVEMSELEQAEYEEFAEQMLERVRVEYNLGPRTPSPGPLSAIGTVNPTQVQDAVAGDVYTTTPLEDSHDLLTRDLRDSTLSVSSSSLPLSFGQGGGQTQLLSPPPSPILHPRVNYRQQSASYIQQTPTSFLGQQVNFSSSYSSSSSAPHYHGTQEAETQQPGPSMPERFMSAARQEKDDEDDFMMEG